LSVEERLTRLEQRIDQLDRIEARLDNIEHQLIGLRGDLAPSLEHILATLDSHDRTLREILATLPRLAFRWPWESRA